MTTKTAEPIDLPAPVAAYFAADTTGAEAVAQCFTDGAVVIDERQEYRGRTAIARWKADVSAKFRYTVDRLGAHVSGDQTTVTGREVSRHSRATRLLGSRSGRELRSRTDRSPSSRRHARFPLTHTLACTTAADIHDVLKIREFLG